MYRILIVGAGYVGSEIAHYFRAQKQKVWALSLSGKNKQIWDEEGIQTIQADITKPETLVELPVADFIVLSPAPSSRDESTYRQIYIEGIRNVLDRIQRNPRPLLIVYLSSTGVWKDQGGEWVNEAFLPDTDSERGKILIEAEKQILDSGLPSVIFRLGGIYGPGRNRIQALKKGKWPEAGDDGYVNLIHRNDIVEAVHHLFKHGVVGETYLGVDNEPILRSEYYAWLCEKINQPVKKDLFYNNAPKGKRCSNKKLKQMGFTFKYPTFREGYQTCL